MKIIQNGKEIRATMKMRTFDRKLSAKAMQSFLVHFTLEL